MDQGLVLVGDQAYASASCRATVTYVLRFHATAESVATVLPGVVTVRITAAVQTVALPSVQRHVGVTETVTSGAAAVLRRTQIGAVSRGCIRGKELSALSRTARAEAVGRPLVGLGLRWAVRGRGQPSVRLRVILAPCRAEATARAKTGGDFPPGYTTIKIVPAK
jgi:hypothetical protein